MKISPGFTLIEMTVVLVILGLLMGSLLIPMSAQMEQKRLDITRQRLETIKETLLGFAMSNEYLPCPDQDKDGQPNPDNRKNCIDNSENKEGYLPWVSLGIEEKYDAWGHPFRYRVDKNFFPGEELIPGTDKKKNPGGTTSGFQIKNYAGSLISSSETMGNVIAIIFSCGKDGNADLENDALDADDQICSNPGVADKIYTQDKPSKDRFDPEKNFDDVLIWISKENLNGSLTAAGKEPILPPPPSP